METFLRNQERLRDHVAGAFGSNPAMANFEALTRANMEIYENAMRMFSALLSHVRIHPRRKRKSPRPRRARDVELDDLKEQLRGHAEPAFQTGQGPLNRGQTADRRSGCAGRNGISAAGLP